MSTAAQAHDPHEDEDPAGTFRLSPEEVEELDAADREADADEATGRLVTWDELRAKLGWT